MVASRRIVISYFRRLRQSWRSSTGVLAQRNASTVDGLLRKYIIPAANLVHAHVLQYMFCQMMQVLSVRENVSRQLKKMWETNFREGLFPGSRRRRMTPEKSEERTN